MFHFKVVEDAAHKRWEIFFGRENSLSKLGAMIDIC